MPHADAVIVTDLENRVTFMNSTAEQFTGWNKSDALHQPLTNICRIVDEQSVNLKYPEKTPQAAGALCSCDPHRA